MRKNILPIIGGIVLGGTVLAVGHIAVAQAFGPDAAMVSKASGGHNEGAYLRLGAPIDVVVSFNPATGLVDVNFTAPGSAWWTDDYEDITPEEKKTTKIDAIKVYRSEGYYHSESQAVLVKEFKDVEWLDDLTFSDDTEMEHGKTYCYYLIGELKGHNGEGATATIAVGYRIDPASDFSVKAAPDAQLSAEISFTAPTTCNNGAYTMKATDLIPKIEITRKIDNWQISDADVIHEFENVVPGTHLAYTDEDEALESGNTYQYRVVMHYDGSVTRDYTNSASVFLGTDKPKAPTALKAELMDDGNVSVSWTAPTEGANGAWFDPERLSYKVERGNGTSVWKAVWTEIANGITALEFVDDAIAEEGYYFYRVTSQIGGEDTFDAVTEESILAGPPAPFPYTESWPSTRPEHSMWETDGSWSIYDKTSVAYYNDFDEYATINIVPADEDGGFIMLSSGYYDATGDVFSLTSGRISTKDCENPVVCFNFFDFGELISDNEVAVLVAAEDEDFEPIEITNLEVLTRSNSWVWLTAPVEGLRSDAEYFRVRFEVTLGELKGKTAIDNIAVRDVLPADLAAGKVQAPATMYPGAAFNLKFNVTNNGDNTSEPFKVVVSLAGNELAGSEEISGLGAHSAAQLSLPVAIPESADDGLSALAVSVIAAGDAAQENNTAETEVNIIALPAPANLDYDSAQGLFTWDAAAPLEFNDGSRLMNENFEDYPESVNGECGEWTVIDGDGSATFSIPGVNLDYPLSGKATGGFVFRPSAYGADWDAPEKGGQCFVFPGSMSKADDWLISPQLTGEAQTLTFRIATSTAGYVSEEYEVCVSSTLPTPEAFTVVKTESIYTELNWDERQVELPEGTLYFAIHYTKGYGDLLAVGEFTFSTGSGLISEPTVLKGYNLYNGDTPVHDAPLTDTRFQFGKDQATSGKYTVKAVYTNAESRPSEPLDVVILGISSADSESAGVEVSGSDIIITGQSQYVITDTAGHMVAAGHGNARINAAPGIYLVSMNNRTYKIHIR